MEVLGEQFDLIHRDLDAVANVAKELQWMGRALGGTDDIRKVAPARSVQPDDLKEHAAASHAAGERLASIQSAFFLGLLLVQNRIARILAATRAAPEGNRV